MKDRNHLANIGLIHQVNVIENGLIDIPMLQVLQPDGTIHPEAVLPDIAEQPALKILQTMQYISQQFRYWILNRK